MKIKIYFKNIITIIIILFMAENCDPGGVGTPEEQQSQCFQNVFLLYTIQLSNNTLTAQEKQMQLIILATSCTMENVHI